MRELIAQAGFTRAEVQGIRRGMPGEEGGKDFAVRVKGVGRERAKKVMQPLVEQKLEQGGLMQGARLETAADGGSLIFKPKEPLLEMQLRQVLAGEGNDPFEIEGIKEIVPPEQVTDNRFALRSAEVSSVVVPELMFGKLLTALAWAGLEKLTYQVELGELQEAGAARQVILKTSAPVHGYLLHYELERRDFSGVGVSPLAEPSDEFTLTGSPKAIEKVKKVLPTSLDLPVAEIEGPTITAVLQKEFSEQDLRAIFDKQRMGDVFLVPVAKASSSYEISLSEQEIEEKMSALFGDLSRQNIEVEFTPLGQDADLPDHVRVKMQLSQSMTFDLMRQYLDAAGLGVYAEDIMVDALAPGVKTQEVTLRLPADQANQIEGLIKESLGKPRPIESIISIGSIVAAEMKGRALLAVLFASVVIVFYVALRFHAFKFGIAAVIALVHDMAITAGLIALADWCGVFGDVKINLAMLAAFLTILGYSLNDTIVVFDRIRENMIAMGKKDVTEEIIDRSLNQTLSRTVLTSATTLIVVVILYIFGGRVLQGLALTLIIGIVVGTYSSVFIASPILLDWSGVKSGTRMFFKIAFFPLTAPVKALRLLKRST